MTKDFWEGYVPEPVKSGEGASATVTITLTAQQEPVAWMYPDDYERMSTSETFCTVYSVEVGSATRGESTVALYTSPPAQRTWVGLTDEELREFDVDPIEAKLMIAKLKEKNT